MLAVITGKLCKINSFILSLIKYRRSTSRMRQKSLFPNLYCFDVVGGFFYFYKSSVMYTNHLLSKPAVCYYFVKERTLLL